MNKKICFQRGTITKCYKCKYLEFCNNMLEIDERIKERELEIERNNNKCFKCVWANKRDLYCPFPKCIEER